MTELALKIANNFIEIRKAIELTKQQYHCSKNAVDFLAVSKKQSVDKIKAAISVGQKKFAESYAQEALPKIDILRAFKLEWHFIGTLQRNKTKEVAENFAWVHSISNTEIAKRLSEQRPDYLEPLNVCLQIKLVDEPQKSGVLSSEALMLAEYIKSLPNMKLRGLMTILPITEDFSEQRILFRKLSQLKHELNDQGFDLDTLSMGMSHDFKAAIVEGATMIRIGSALFGKRET